MTGSCGGGGKIALCQGLRHAPKRSAFAREGLLVSFGEPSRCGRLLMGSATWEPKGPKEYPSKLATILYIFSTNILANFDCVDLWEERGWSRTAR
jgi:hypothetical protein